MVRSVPLFSACSRCVFRTFKRFEKGMDRLTGMYFAISCSPVLYSGFSAHPSFPQVASVQSSSLSPASSSEGAQSPSSMSSTPPSSSIPKRRGSTAFSAPSRASTSSGCSPSIVSALRSPTALPATNKTSLQITKPSPSARARLWTHHAPTSPLAAFPLSSLRLSASHPSVTSHREEKRIQDDQELLGRSRRLNSNERR